jgi:hypothetical protein
MGAASAQSVSPQATQGARAPMLRVAVAAHLAEVTGLVVAIVFGLVDSASGQSWTASNAAGFIVIEVIAAVAVGLLALGIARLRPWSRTPAVMTQVFVVMIAVWLLEAHRYAWGIPALVLAIAGLAGLFAPASLRALSRQP